MIKRWLPFFCLIIVAANFGSAADDVIDEERITDVDRDHWAFRPVKKQAIPNVSDKNWSSTKIDRFVLAKLESRSLRPVSRASKATLIRRLYLDLTGLPPTSQSVYEFLGDDRPGAYARLVDHLLASPDYGQRWGQHWLDLARFAETDGFEHDKVRPTAWRYRDWVIEALNHDMPYDKFVRWQIAGDQIAPDNPDAKVATAFCVSGPDMPDINSQDERRHVLLNDMTSTIGSVFLSLQVGCAQCHDHKYDPISQADFYRLRAYFDHSVRLQKNKSVTVLASHDGSAESRLMIRGDWNRPGPKLNAATPRVLEFDVQATRRADGESRRADLASWLTDTQHPITARSIVNRVWQYHFGRGLSDTPSDFGVMGNSPTHPELLDFLATELMKNDWSLKWLHRQILRSSVYQLASARNLVSARTSRTAEPSKKNVGDAEDLVTWQESIEHDSDNRWLSRFARRRLDGEVIRDCMFAASQSLSRDVDGVGVFPPLPKEMLQTLLKGQWRISEREADHYRRSVYMFARRNLRYPFFATFDRPAANSSCPLRNKSTTPVQSLMLLNSTLTTDAADRLAKVLGGYPKEEKITELHVRLFARRPTKAEQEDCQRFLAQQDIGMSDLCRALMNTNEFVYCE